MHITNGSSFAPLESQKFALHRYHTLDTYTIFYLVFNRSVHLCPFHIIHFKSIIRMSSEKRHHLGHGGQHSIGIIVGLFICSIIIATTHVWKVGSLTHNTFLLGILQFNPCISRVSRFSMLDQIIASEFSLPVNTEHLEQLEGTKDGKAPEGGPNSDGYQSSNVITKSIPSF